MTGLKLYADLPNHRARQILGDVLLVLWIAVWIWLAGKVHDATERLAVPGHRIDQSAGDLAGQLRDAGNAVDDLPLVGGSVSRPFDGAGGAADKLAAAGRAQVDAVDSLAFWLALATALVPILLAVAFYVPPRVRFARRAGAGRRFLDSNSDLDLFALRALAHQPLHVLARISDDPAGAWRAQHPDVVRRLAALELADVGLVPPPGLGRLSGDA
jgi:hypothetical protein